MKTTTKGVCLNLYESEYKFNYGGKTFFFSSEFYKNKFIESISNYIETETFKLQVKYNVNIKFDDLFLIALYKKIEKRGFRILDENNKEITPSCGIITNIIN